MKVSAQYAQERFYDILSAADNGEVSRSSAPKNPRSSSHPVRPNCRLPPAKRSRRELFGAWEDKGIVLPTNEEWRAMDKEIEDEMLNGSV